MDKKIESLKLAYSQLDWNERKQIRDYTEEFEKLPDYETKMKKRDQLKNQLGPVSSSACPLCGK